MLSLQQYVHITHSYIPYIDLSICSQFQKFSYIIVPILVKPTKNFICFSKKKKKKKTKTKTKNFILFYFNFPLTPMFTK